MNLKEKINNDLKEAMKARDKTRLATIRSIRALILEFEKSGSNKELTSDDEIKMLTSAAKKRKDSIEQYKNAGRDDLASKEEAELEILSVYLPKQLSEEDAREEIIKLAEEIGASTKEDFPKLMPLAIKLLKGRIDGKQIKNIVDNLLSGN